jgi:hypothetical protein
MLTICPDCGRLWGPAIVPRSLCFRCLLARCELDGDEREECLTDGERNPSL